MRPFLPNPGQPLTASDGKPDQTYYRFFAAIGNIIGPNGAVLPSAGGTGVSNADGSTITVAGPFVVASHGVTFSVPSAGTTMTLPSASKTLMATDFSNASLAGGDLSGSFPSPTVTNLHITAGGDLSGSLTAPTVAKINGTPLGTMTATAGHITVFDGSALQSVAMSGGATIDATGAVTLHGSLPPGGSAGGDLSGTFPNPTVAKINGVGLGTTTATAGNILVGDGTNWQSRTMSGAGSLSSTGVLSISHGASGQNGATGTSTSATGTMLGIAGAITPATSGTVFFIITGSAHHSNAGGTVNYQIRYGTGTAPIAGAALTGTAAGNKMGAQSVNATSKFSFSNCALVSGLIAGTTYWFDIGYDNGGAGTATVDVSTMDAMEI